MPWKTGMVARDPSEPHRTATPLELLFDLVFVTAVAQVAAQLDHALLEGHAAEGVISYLMLFGAIWWAWISFTWFASAFDTDDGPYRILAFVQIAGSLVLAAGVPAAFDDLDFRWTVLGYVIMRIAYVAQWLRAGREHPAVRTLAIKLAAGTTAVQVLWVLQLLLPDDYRILAFIVLFLVDLSVPWFAGWNADQGGFHAHHIAERFGLFTLIVIGESITAATLAIQGAFAAQGHVLDLIVLAVAALLISLSVWWLYFGYMDHRALRTNPRTTYIWSYGHYFILAAIAAGGAGVAVIAASVGGHGAHLPEWGVALALTVPVAVFLFAFAAIDALANGRRDLKPVVFAAAGMVVLALTPLATVIGGPWTALVTALIVVALLAKELLAHPSEDARSRPAE
ncbi:low temperature requirement protein A [Herbidospora cretacea]|uniref:low temperature requirement protein A n=1 Tax=Herbidospora cretacea TaxID=28444 RepID=UPI001470C97E|nr:low temperature requirement protein A [Herbidospora cretacea]